MTAEIYTLLYFINYSSNFWPLIDLFGMNLCTCFQPSRPVHLWVHMPSPPIYRISNRNTTNKQQENLSKQKCVFVQLEALQDGRSSKHTIKTRTSAVNGRFCRQTVNNFCEWTVFSLLTQSDKFYDDFTYVNTVSAFVFLLFFVWFSVV